MVALQVLEGKAEDFRELVRVSGFEAQQLGLADADQRRRDRLVGAALGRLRDARRRCDQEKAGALVDRVDEGIQPARYERVVERADRDQALAEQRPGQAERREQQEQVVLGDPELDVLAAPALGPQLRRGQALLLEHVGMLGAIEHAAPADPRAQAGRHGDVGEVVMMRGASRPRRVPARP